MSGSVNKVTLVGNLGRDPEGRTMNNGKKVVSFSLATSDRWKDKEGNQQEKTEWHNVVIFNERLGEVAEKYLRKGSLVYLEGSLSSRQYTANDGNERNITEVVLSQFRGDLALLDNKPTDSAAPAARKPAQAKGKPNKPSTDFDDEIPY